MECVGDQSKYSEYEKNSKKYKVVLSLKHQRRLSPNEFMSYFERIGRSGLYLPSFTLQLHSMGKNLPSESFRLARNFCGLGYLDIDPAIGADNKPTNSLQELVPAISGYIIFNKATGVPILDPLVLKREDILNRTIKVSFYDNERFLYGAATVEAGWNEAEEDIWTFNSVGNVGTNPIVFKWCDSSKAKQIDIVFEFVSSIKSSSSLKGRREAKVLEVTNGWTKVPLEKLAEAATHVLDIHAGTPVRPFALDENDVRANRKGFFAGVSKRTGRGIRSQLSITSRPYAKLLTMKQVKILFSIVLCQAAAWTLSDQ
eukprot:TRINITY_DN5873_c0_g5_i1.p1 TRINITY_DN5873_c0_g5~~TRINITY_DN5873_c0_g5_i1.p1  ORF type:complete len:314 (-),score=40.18 TRINITY_DN5873_c0_g5_i1:691-1632(-)